MRSRNRVKIIVILLPVLVLGLITTVSADLFTKSTTSPTNVIYSADNVLYPLSHQISITKSIQRGFPFISQTKVVTIYKNEEFTGSKIWVQVPAISSTGSNSFTRILLTWQFYVDALIWTIVWFLLVCLIKSIKHMKAK